MAPSASRELASELRRFTVPAVVLAAAGAALATFGWQSSELSATSPAPPDTVVSAERDDVEDADAERRPGEPVVHLRR